MTELPNGWTWMRLRDLAVLKGGITKGNKRSRTSPTRLVPYLRVANVQRGFLDLEEVKEIEADETEINALQLQPGDVLFNEGGDRDKLGRGWIWHGELPICIHQNHVFRARIRDGLLLPKLLSWYGNSLGQSYFLEHGKQTTNLASINLTLLGDLPVPVPPRDEQAPLVAEIDTQTSRIEAGVAALTRVQANLKRYRASVLKAACEGRLVPTEAELARRESRDYEPASVLLQRILKERRHHWEASELFKLRAKVKPPTDDSWKSRYKEAEALDTTKLPHLPEGWCWATTDMVGDILLGRQRAPQYLTGKWTRPYLRVANVKDDRVDLSDIETMDFDPVHFAQYRLLPGDILVSEGQSPELVGQSAIYQGGIDGLCFQKTLHRFRRMPHGPTPEFAQIVFRAHVKTGFFQKVASITTNIAHLTLEKFKASPFPLPPIAEQVRITAEVKRRTSLADHLQEALGASAARAGRLRQSILASAFQGKLTGSPDASGAEARNPANASARPLRSSHPDEAFADA